MNGNIFDGWDNMEVESFIDRNSHFKNSRINVLNNEDFFFNLNVERDFLRAYRECAPLKSIVGKRAKYTNTGEVKVYNSNTDKVAVGSEAKIYQRVLKKPNILQTGKQFFAQQNIYLDIFGYCPVVRMRPVGMVDEITSIWNLPPWLFDLTFTRNWLLQNSLAGIFEKFFIIWNGQRIEIDAKDLTFIFDDGIGCENDSNLHIPDSRLISLEYPVSNIIAAYKSRNTLITKRGAIGVLSNSAKDTAGVIPLDPKEKMDLQNDFKKYGLIGQPFQVIISEASLQWQQMGFATKDLLLFEEVEDDINRLCDQYGMQTELMALTIKGSFNSSDREEAIKSMYRDTIIPESCSRMEQFTHVLVTDPTSALYVDRDFSEVEVLKESKKAAAEARGALDTALEKEYKNGLITKNMWLTKLGEPTVADPKFDEYYDNTATETSTAKTDTGLTA